MAIYSLSQRTSNVTIANACWEIRSSATGKPKVFEIGITINAATASVFGLGRPAAIGVTPTSPQTFLAEDLRRASARTVVRGGLGHRPDRAGELLPANLSAEHDGGSGSSGRSREVFISSSARS